MTTFKETCTTEWNIWRGMWKRCSFMRLPDYECYGGRGIVVDPAWEHYEQFLADMGRRPSLKHTLHRINNNGPYNKANCKWATIKEQNRNKRNIKLTKEIADIIWRDRDKHSTRYFAAKYGVSNVLVWRITRGELWN